MFYKTQYESPVGLLSLAGNGETLSGMWIEGQKYFESTVKEEMIVKDDLPVFDAARDLPKRSGCSHMKE